MPQTLINVGGVSGKPDAEKIMAAGEALEGVRLVNVNINDGRVVVTHTADFDIETFKKTVTDLGYSA